MVPYIHSRWSYGYMCWLYVLITYVVVDVDECFSQPCGHHGNCTDQPNGYLCNCDAGYNGTQCEGECNKRCIDRKTDLHNVQVNVGLSVHRLSMSFIIEKHSSCNEDKTLRVLQLTLTSVPAIPVNMVRVPTRSMLSTVPATLDTRGWRVTVILRNAATCLPS